MSEEATSASNSPERRRFRFTLKQLSIAVAVVAVLLAVWVGLIRKVVTIRPARSDDPIHERYFGIDGENTRTVAITWLSRHN